MPTDLPRFESNERVDLGDFENMIDGAPQALARQVNEEFLTDPGGGTKSWIIDGFAMSDLGAGQFKITKGRALLAQREGAEIHYGALTTEGDASKTLDLSGYGNDTYNAYIRFQYEDAETQSRMFWNPSGSGTEFAQSIQTRRKASWSMRVELASPGDEWTQIGTVEIVGGVIGGAGIADQRNFYFEGVVSDTYANTWGGGNDRNVDRQQYGIKDLQTFTAAVRTLFEDLRPSGGRWWEARGLKATGKTGSNEPGFDGIGDGSGSGLRGVGGTSGYGIEGIGGGADKTGVYGEGGPGGDDGIGLEGLGIGGGGGAFGVKGTGGAGAAGVHGTGVDSGIGVRAIGGTGNGVGLNATATGSGNAASVTNSGTGVGLHANSIANYGLIAEGDTSSPGKAAFRIVPQDTSPSSVPAGGDICAKLTDSTTKLKIYNGEEWDRYRAISFTVAVASTKTNSATARQFTSGQYPIPADTLKTGTSVRIRASGIISADADANTVYFTAKIGTSVGAGGTVLAQTSTRTVVNNERFTIDAEFTVGTAGTDGARTILRNGMAIFSGTPDGTAGDATSIANITTIDTTVEQIAFIGMVWGVGTSGNEATQIHFSVEVTAPDL